MCCSNSPRRRNASGERGKKVAQEELEIHLHVPRLAKPSSNVKHKQILLLHAEAKGLGTRWYLVVPQNDAEASSDSFSVCFSPETHMLILFWLEES